jgi:hypothetical protein
MHSIYGDPYLLFRYLHEWSVPIEVVAILKEQPNSDRKHILTHYILSLVIRINTKILHKT